MRKKDEISGPPGLEDISKLFPPLAPASPSPVANVSMKLPAFWPDAAEIWLVQADTQFAIWNVSVSKTKFYQVNRSPSLRGCFTDFGPDPLSSGGRSLWSSPRATDKALYSERLSVFQGSGLPPSLRWSENLPIWWTGCWLSSQMITNRTSSSGDCSYNVFLSMCTHIFYTRKFQTLELWLWKQTNSTREGSPLCPWIFSPRF